MASVLNFNLSYVANLINSVVTLFDPSPAFQYERKTDGSYQILSGNQVTRNNLVASAGFNASEIVQVDLNGNNIYVPSTVPLPLPANSYVINTPSQVYGTSVAGNTYSVFQINPALALIEPGFSRIQVSYQYFDPIASNMNNFTEYFDCPFYEGFNTTAQELNNLLSYVEQGYAFLQKEIDILDQEVSYALSHELWRGTSVSGQISVVPATEGLQTGALTVGEFPHNLDIKDVSSSPTPTYAQLKASAFTAGSSGISLTQTTPSTPTEFGRDTSINGMPDAMSRYGFYISEAVDGTGNRCVVLVVGSYWGASSNGSITIRNNFTATGGAVDKTIGAQSGFVYSHITAYCGGLQSNDSPVAQSPNMTTAYPTQTGAAPDQNTLGAYTRVYEEYPHNTSPTGGRFVGYVAGSSPLWMKGYYGDGNPESNNDGPSGSDNGGFSPPTSGPTNNTATGTVSTGYVGMSGGVWDTVNIAGENHPRLVFYPDNSTTNITINPIAFNLLTCDDFNGGDGGHGTNTLTNNLALASSSQNGTTINNGNAILPYTLNLTPVFPASGPVISSSGNPSDGCIGQIINLVGSNFYAQYDSVYIAGQPCPLQVTSATTCKATIPSVTLGPTTLQITDGVHAPSTIPFTVLGQPLLSNVSPSQAPAGTNITISGSNFGVQDGNSRVAFGSTTATIVSWSNTSIVVTVPSGLALGPTQINVFNDCGEQSTSQFSVSNPDSIVVNPHLQTVSANTTFQFQALFYAGNNSPVNVTSGVHTTWSVNGEIGGESIHGTITQSGLYSAPSSAPPSPISVSAQYYDSNTGLYIGDSATVLVTAGPALLLSPANIQLGSGASQQYVATLVVNNVSTDVSSSVSYFVNETPGGDLIDGTISNSGLYVSPNNLTTATIETITATYVYDSITYTATAQATVAQAPSAFASITVTSQINVFLGDGRFGYVPTGTQIYAYPAQYVYVQFQELLDNQYHLPVSTYLPVQQLAVNTKNALATDVANVIYNLGNMTLNADGTVGTYRTVVLGIIDPSDGRWHSMWDIGAPIAGPALGGHDLDMKSLDVKSAEQIPAFSNKKNGFSGNILQYIDELSGGAQSQLDSLNEKANTILVGNCKYDEKNHIFSIVDSLNVLKLSEKSGYKIFGTIPKQSITLLENQYLYIDEKLNLCVKNIGDMFKDSENTDIIVVGMALDKFYTKWNIINSVETDVSRVEDFGKTSIMKVGPLLIQWGTIAQEEYNKKSMKNQKITLEEVYTKSYSALATPYNASGGTITTETLNIELDSFSIKVANNGSSNVKSEINWITIGY